MLLQTDFCIGSMLNDLVCLMVSYMSITVAANAGPLCSEGRVHSRTQGTTSVTVSSSRLVAVQLPR